MLGRGDLLAFAQDHRGEPAAVHRARVEARREGLELEAAPRVVAELQLFALRAQPEGAAPALAADARKAPR